jgi:hypothetical protein
MLSTTAGAALAEVTENPTRNVYCGETHMHTAYSLDAFFGGTIPMPARAIQERAWSSPIGYQP